MLREPPQGRGFGIGVRLTPMSLRLSRMIQGPGLKFGRDALGHGDWEKSVAKLVGRLMTKQVAYRVVVPASDNDETLYLLRDLGTTTLGGIIRGRRERAMNPRHTIQAVIRSGDESGYVAECVDFPVVSQGATVEESLSNLREAVGLMLDGEDLAA